MLTQFHNGLIGRWLGSVLMLMALLIPGQTRAIELEGLYQGEVPVKDQSRDSRFDVYPEALSQVVVKITGDRSVPALPQLHGFIANAVKLVQQFGYRDLPEDRPLLAEEYSHMLVVNFDRAGVSQALIEAGVPIWGSTRPEVLLWLAIEDRGSRYLLAANQLAELQSTLEEAAHDRGLPLVLPLLDLEDQMQLSYADVWGDFRSSIVRASERYGADAVLVGRMFRDADGSWQTRWSLYDTDDSGVIPQRWQEQANDQQEALAGGINAATDRIAQRYAQVYSIDSGDSVALAVTAVDDLQGYARAMAYLESLDMVSSVQPQRVENDEVLFRLTIRGDLAGLARAIDLGSTLRRVSKPEGDLVAQAFVYQLLP